MTGPIKISVLVCTYNRSRTLAATLESVVSQTLPQRCGWEILVVDNNSKDETRKVVEGFQRRYPELVRYFFEPQQGVSFARNAGIREARGEILAFIDDDETAQSRWLQSLTASLHSGEWAGTGGRVLPPPGFSPPRWLSTIESFVNGPLASFDRGLNAGELSEPPFGANMAFRREVFDKLGGFRTDLGRSGNSMVSNEDTEFGRRVMAAGLRLRYEPSALTYHPVEEYRLHREYFLVWWFNKGRSDVRESWCQSNGKRLLGIPVRLFRALAWETVRWMTSTRPAQRFGCKLNVWVAAGQILESYYQWQNARQRGHGHSANIEPPGGRVQ